MSTSANELTWSRGPDGILRSVPRPVSVRAPGKPITWLTVAEVAVRLRVSKMTIYRLAEAGDLGAVRVGRCIRIPAAAVTAYLGGTLT